MPFEQNNYYYEISVGIEIESETHYDRIILKGSQVNPKYEFTSGCIPGKKWSEYQGTINLYAVFSDNSKYLILLDQNIEDDIDFIIPPGTKEVILESNGDSFLVKRRYYHELTMYLFISKISTTNVKSHSISKNVYPSIALH